MEFWGLGDLTFSTPLLDAAEERWDITLVGKEHARPLLEPSFPKVQFLSYDAPWSAYKGKYKLWTWNWKELFRLIGRLRRKRFDAAVSVRNDPRDHLLMALIGAKTRYGFPIRGSNAFLTHPLTRSRRKQHRVEDWRDIGTALGLPEMAHAEPHLKHHCYRSERIDTVLAGVTKPLICIHPGARIPVRRWPESYFAYICEKLRAHFDFHLLLIPDPDGYGAGLEQFADTVIPPLAVSELVDVLGRVDLLICNDSGPGHLSASCGRPAIPIFGPTDPEWFRPWGDIHKLVIRDICPWRPCFDYCKFDQPYCMTKLLPEAVWPEIRNHIFSLIENSILPRSLENRSLPTPA